MQSVIETPTFLSDAKQAGMGDDERSALVALIAANPEAGDIMQGTGGARKLRFKRPGMGKSGGYRVIFYYAGDDAPIFLSNVFIKGDRANLSKAEQNTLRTILARMVDIYRKGQTT